MLERKGVYMGQSQLNVLCLIFICENFTYIGVSLVKRAMSPVSAVKRTYNFAVSLVKKMSVSKDRSCKTGVSPVSIVSIFTHVYP